MVTLICQNCGRKYKKPPSAAKRSKYCCRSCHSSANSKANQKHKYVVRKCKVCGNEFETYTRHGGSKTCSPQCANQLKGINAAKSRQNYSKKITKPCQHCGTMFESYKSRNRLYCSRKCKHAAHSENGRVVIPCAFCGKPTEFIKAQIELRGGKYCSKECRYNAMSIARTGANNPNWVGGSSVITWRGPNWGRQKRKAKRRDKFTCQICGQIHRKSSRNIHVHHIVPFRLFSDYKRANHIDNLISLCMSCHGKAENITRHYVDGIQEDSLRIPSLKTELRHLILESQADST